MSPTAWYAPHTRAQHAYTPPTALAPARSYYNLSRFNERFERAVVLQAQEDVRWARREKEILDNERALMANVPGWVVNKRRYATQFEEKPDRDAVDPRRASVW